MTTHKHQDAIETAISEEIAAREQLERRTAAVLPTTDLSKVDISKMDSKQLAAWKKALAEAEKQKRLQERQQKKDELAAKQAEKQQLASPPTLLPGENGIHRVPLSQLVFLDQCAIPDGERAMRAVNDEHAESMLFTLQNGGTLPPLRVQPSTRGYIVWDGGHRSKAYHLFLRSILQEEGRLEGSEDSREQDALVVEEAKASFPVEVEDSSFNNFFDLLNAAYTANFDHGLPASPGFKSEYADWYFHKMREIGSPVSVRTAETQARLKHPALLNYWRRKEEKETGKKAGKKTDVVVQLSGEDIQDLAQFNEEERQAALEREAKKSNEDPAVPHIRNLMKAAIFFTEAGWDEVGDIADAFDTMVGPMLKGKINRTQISTLLDVVRGFSEIVYNQTADEGLIPAEAMPKGHKQTTLITHK